MNPRASCATLGRALQCALEAMCASPNTECLIRKSRTTFELFTSDNPRTLSFLYKDPPPYCINLLTLYSAAPDPGPLIRVTNMQLQISGTADPSALGAITSALVNTQ